MNYFNENKCRLCAKAFCCQSCRERHETETHKIILDCDICVYGRAVLSTQQLTNHIKKSHWPLHCVYCKRIFWFDEDLFQHKKCSVGDRNILEKSVYSPVTEYLVKDLQVNNNLASSTPMQRGELNKLEKISQVIITPVDSCENTQEIFTKIHQLSSNQSGSLKGRRVTFCETPITQNYRQTGDMSTNDENGGPDDISKTPVSGSNSEAFYSANTDFFNNIETILTPRVVANPPLDDNKKVDSQSDETRDNQEPKYDKKRNTNNQDITECLQESSTLWISAMNLSTPIFKQENNRTNANIFFTPVAVSIRKKINIVMPTPVIREETMNQISRPIQISSTPISFTLPTESVPNQSDIFTPNEHYSSSSCSHLDQSEPLNNENLSDSDKNIEKLSQDHSSSSQSHFDESKVISSENLSSSYKNVEKFSRSDSYQDLIMKTSKTTRSFIRNMLWKSVSRIIENVSYVVHGLSSSDEENSNTSSSKSIKRFLDYDSLDEPEVKRYKLTDIKCRRTIRELPPVEISRELHIKIVNTNVDSLRDSMKKFVDKSTQTD